MREEGQGDAARATLGLRRAAGQQESWGGGCGFQIAAGEGIKGAPATGESRCWPLPAGWETLSVLSLCPHSRSAGGGGRGRGI